MAQLSELLLSYPDINTFTELTELIKHAGDEGVMFLEFDVKPDFNDTPRDWQWRLETAFTRGTQYD